MVAQLPLKNRYRDRYRYRLRGIGRGRHDSDSDPDRDLFYAKTVLGVTVIMDVAVISLFSITVSIAGTAQAFIKLGFKPAR